MPSSRASFALACGLIAGCGDPDGVTARPPLPPSAASAGAGALPATPSDAGGVPSEPSDASGMPSDASGASTDGGARTYSLGSLAGDLVGYWALGETIGGCIDTQEYLAFFPDASAESIRVDDDACSPEERGLFITPASYALTGRSLTFTTPTTLERHAVAVSEQYGQRSLCQRVLVQVEPLHWQGSVEVELTEGEGVFLRRKTQVDLFLDAQPPPQGEAAGTAELRYEITARDERRALAERDTSVADAFPALTWRSRPNPYDPSLMQLEVLGDLNRVFDELFVSSNVGAILSLGFAGFLLSLDPAQPDFLDSGYCVPALDAPPAVLRR